MFPFNLQEIIDHLLIDFGDYHQPVFDADRDGFSAVSDGLRGASWRGTDCGPNDVDTYPGRMPYNNDTYFDSNCNGISGIDEDGIPYEAKYCSEYPSRGIAILGDSAGAHFAIPNNWMRPTVFNQSTFDNILMILTNELDWPMLSWATGMSENCWYEDIHSYSDVQMDSLYKRMFEWNRCGLNDYQNQANNGARSTSMADKIVKGLTRDQTIDKPQIVFLSLIGNDVCNGHIPTENSFTPVQKFHDKTLKTLQHLNTVLPMGSTVILTGLADGGVLWELLKGRMHPLGEYRSDMDYPALYGYLECLEVSPCLGWMSANETLRTVTTEHAMKLSKVAQDIAETETFEHFDMIYYDFDIRPSIELWEEQGGEGWQLIEAVDGFHPSQTSNVLTAQIFWEQIMRDRPEVFGERNPFNEQIEKIQQMNFGFNKCNTE